MIALTHKQRNQIFICLIFILIQISKSVGFRRIYPSIAAILTKEQHGMTQVATMASSSSSSSSSSSTSSTTTTSITTKPKRNDSGKKPFITPAAAATTTTTTTTLQFQRPLFNIRGGANKKKRSSSVSNNNNGARSATGKKKVGTTNESSTTKKHIFQTLWLQYKQMLPLTKIQITMIMISSICGFIVDEELLQSILALDPTQMIYGLQIWRPITAATFLGKPSISSLLEGYYLYQYGSTLERTYGSAQHMMLLITQIITLTIFSILTGLPFFASALITSMLYILSRITPKQQVQWIIFKVPIWTLPYGLIFSSILQQQSPLPHILGILSGHLCYFQKFIWPKMGHNHIDWLVPPEFIQRLFLSLNNSNNGDKNIINNNKVLKNRKKKSTGRKISSATTTTARNR